jgi:hypothetical protein
MAAFIWQSKNVEHIADHSVAPEEAEYVVLHARPPYPEYIGDAKYRVRGQTRDGRYLQVIYVFGVDAADIDWGEIDLALVDPEDPDNFYVVHAMQLPDRDKRQYRRRRR